MVYPLEDGHQSQSVIEYGLRYLFYIVGVGREGEGRWRGEEEKRWKRGAVDGSHEWGREWSGGCGVVVHKNQGTRLVAFYYVPLNVS